MFKATQIIGLTNDDVVSPEHCPFKQMIKRLNRTYKASYRHTNVFDNIDGLTMVWLFGSLITTFCALFLPSGEDEFEQSLKMGQGTDDPL